MPNIVHHGAIPETGETLTQKILQRLGKTPFLPWRTADPALTPSVVLFLLDMNADGRPAVILNKRSRWVRQPGDLCFPGGGVSPRVDRFFGKCLMMPGSPLRAWPLWETWRQASPQGLSELAYFLAVGLREGFEEMGINPFRVAFLGPLPQGRLPVYSRTIFPLAVRLRGQKRFRTNWEVEKVLRVPLTDFLNPSHYVRFVIPNLPATSDPKGERVRELLCFRVGRQQREPELLWGITLRIIMTFLREIFHFTPPALDRLPMMNGHLSRPYLSELFLNGSNGK